MPFLLLLVPLIIIGSQFLLLLYFLIPLIFFFSKKKLYHKGIISRKEFVIFSIPSIVMGILFLFMTVPIGIGLGDAFRENITIQSIITFTYVITFGADFVIFILLHFYSKKRQGYLFPEEEGEDEDEVENMSIRIIKKIFAIAWPLLILLLGYIMKIFLSCENGSASCLEAELMITWFISGGIYITIINSMIFLSKKKIK